MNHSIPVPPIGTPLPAPSVEMKIDGLIQRDLKRGRAITSGRIWDAISALNGDASPWGKPFYQHLLTCYGIMRQSPGENIHGPIEDPCAPKKAKTFHSPENVDVIRIGGVFICAGIESGIYVARIRSHSYESYRLISPPVDSHGAASDMALNNEGSPMANRDGFAIFNK